MKSKAKLMHWRTRKLPSPLRETSEIEVGKEPGEVEALFCVCEKFLQTQLESDTSQNWWVWALIGFAESTLKSDICIT